MKINKCENSNFVAGDWRNFQVKLQILQSSTSITGLIKSKGLGLYGHVERMRKCKIKSP
jgi:hypothetical protein